MAEAKRWTRNELLIALNLYGKLRFGQFHSKQPVIVDVAGRLNRTPSSLAMKLSNFASLDPALKSRGISGLQGASMLDKAVWEEFQEHPEDLVAESEEGLRQLFDVKDEKELDVVEGRGVAIQTTLRPPDDPTAATAQVIVRRGQQYFRQAVLNAYGGCCAVSGIAIRELLVASHILPWSTHSEHRLQVQNGIALSRLHDAAFDRGLISFDDEYRLILSSRMRDYLPQESLDLNFSRHEGKALRFMSDSIPPSREHLAAHRASWGFR
jgi:putative restriction endonuclease